MEDISVVMQKIIGVLLVVFSVTGCSTVPEPVAKDEHVNCMYMLLDNGNPGDSCKWNDGKNKGTVTVAMIKPNLCHVLISTVERGNSSKTRHHEACYTQNNKWKFYDR